MKRALINIVIGGLTIGLILFVRPWSSSLPEQLSWRDGFSYLRDHYQDFQYDDSYLQYHYPNENLNCPVANCRLSYRLMDAFFNVKMLSQAGASADELGQQYQDAECVFELIRPEWQAGSIAQTLTGSSPNGFALDTYCIFGYLFQDQAMARVVRQASQGTEWLAEDLYSQDVWRNLADETWCLRLLLATDTDRDFTGQAITKKIEQTDAFLNTATPFDQYAVLYHMIPLLSESEEHGDFKASLQNYTDRLSQHISRPEFEGQALVLANALEVFCSIDHLGREKIQTLTKRLLKLQDFDGGWWPYAGADDGKVFTTLRVLLVLTRCSIE